MAALLSDSQQVAAAKSVCAGCSVLEVCLWSAMADEQGGRYRQGVRGGLTELQRCELAAQIAEAGESLSGVITERLYDELAHRRAQVAPATTPPSATCARCGAAFTPRHRGHKFCRMSCSEASRPAALQARLWREKQKQRPSELGRCA